MKIRPMEKTDLPGCAEVFIRVYNADEFGDAWTPETAGRRLLDAWNTPESFGLVAENENGDAGSGIAGFLLGHSEQWFSETQFHLREICVLPDRRRRGIGTALLESLLEEAVRRNLGAVYVYAGRNTPSWDFLRVSSFFQNDRVVQMVQRL